MSYLTSVLQLLQVLTTLSGCNIYYYVEGKRRPFQQNQNLYIIVGALHRFWLIPWLILMLFRNLSNLMLEFLMGLSEYSPKSMISLDVMYKVERAVILYQNFIITIAIYYNYRYRSDRLKLVLNEFYTMYRQYFHICGQKVKINWSFALLPTIRMISASVIPLTSPKIVKFGKVAVFMKISTLLFVCIQPLLLCLLANLGVLIIYSFYGIEYKIDPRKRPFVWAGLLECFMIFAGSFHMELYDQHLAYYFLKNLLLTSLWPLNFFYITTSIHERERNFGQLRFNSRPQRQHQLFWLYRQVMFNAVDTNKFNVFRLNRKTLLEMLSLGWGLAMFTNGLMVNSSAGIEHFKGINKNKKA